MNRRHALQMLAALPLIGFTQSRAQSFKDMASSMQEPLIGMLRSKLNITDNQAKGGVGSLLTLAKEKLPGTDFTKLTNLVPGASKYMELAKTLGAVAGPLKNVAGLNGALGKLGMNKDTVAKFVPTITGLLQKTGGSTVSTLLAAVIN